MNGIWIENQECSWIKFTNDIRIEKHTNYRVICDGRYFGTFNNRRDVNRFISMLTKFIMNGCDENGDTIFHIPTQEEMDLKIKKADEIFKEYKKGLITGEEK